LLNKANDILLIVRIYKKEITKMDLYGRDYTKPISSEEKEALNKFDEFNNQRKSLKFSGNPLHAHPDIECRKFLWCYNSKFPNNCLYSPELREIDLKSEADNFKSVIYDSGDEKSIQDHIKNNKKWFIAGSIFQDYNFVHHEAYLFPELQLGEKYRVDYALLGKSSDGYSMVFVEFENANCDFILKNSNTESESVRKGITQINDWKLWIEDNREYFFRSLAFAEKNITIPLSRFFYCLVVSRRDKMDERATILRNRLCDEKKNTTIMTFDRLSDYIPALKYGY
jgi:hypothetical protein